MKRRTMLKGMGAVAAIGAISPNLALGQSPSTLTFVPAAGLAVLDPIWTTAAVTRAHGYLIFDSLYALDKDFLARRQMAASDETSEDGREVVIELRDGLTFHDGSPVTAEDVVVSLNRWMQKGQMGTKLLGLTEELAALDDKRLRFTLSAPFPPIFETLGSVGPQALIMPARLASTSHLDQVTEMVGSGPYRFIAEEFRSGDRAVYERFADYIPTDDTSGTGLTAGPKIAHFDRVVWTSIPDPSTAAAALSAGEVDWIETPPAELTEILRLDDNLHVETADFLPQVINMRFNHLNAPFDRPEVRRALLHAVNQADYVAAIIGANSKLGDSQVGVYTPGTPSASMEGLETLLAPPDYEAARKALQEAGYDNEPLVQLAPSDNAGINAYSEISAAMFREMGFNLDYQLSDWATVVQRRASKAPIGEGGWSVMHTTSSWFEFYNPGVSNALRTNGPDAGFGWPDIPQLEAMRDSWFEAPDAEGRNTIARDIQVAAMEEVVFVPLGAFFPETAHRADLVDRVKTLPVFWGIRRQ